jgi:BolA family transcriptional regulator, general stress-responsive regulator
LNQPLKPIIVRPTVGELQERFDAAFPDSLVAIEDESHLHAGHAGAEGGAGHYKVAITSGRFLGLNTLAKHRLVYDCVSDLMPHRVHALSISASA